MILAYCQERQGDELEAVIQDRIHSILLGAVIRPYFIEYDDLFDELVV